MAGFAVSSRVVSQNRTGRFIAACQHAATATVKELIEEGAQLSREMAPVGAKHDRRTIPLNQSIETFMYSSTQGAWRATARHALHQEFGTSAHPIIGSPFLKFWWANEGRMWIPGLFGSPDYINHPGHGEQPYLRPAFKAIRPRALEIMRSRYP